MLFLLASTKHKLMGQSEREEYRQRYPHLAPEVAKGLKPSVQSDTFSFGYLYCSTLKILGEKKST